MALADRLKERVFGHDKAVEIITEVIQRSSRAGLNNPLEPMIVGMFSH
jgi:ATP-dependent Clp protease ATP-binding subunit ClpA